MKKMIRASRYAKDADRDAKWLAFEARALADILEAETEEEIREALKGHGHFIETAPKDVAIDGIMKHINQLYEYYLNHSSAASNYEPVKEKLINFLKSQGYPMTKLSKSQWGDESYVIIPADEVEFADLNRVCKDVRDEFDVKYDTPLSGSWTGHSSNLNGVTFHISLERDYDFDPSGKESSLQLYF